MEHRHTSNRKDSTEERARLASETGVRLTITKGQLLLTVMPASVSLSLRDFQVRVLLILCIHTSLLFLQPPSGNISNRAKSLRAEYINIRLPRPFSIKVIIIYMWGVKINTAAAPSGI
jgi:hypothetical protein